MSIKIIKPGVFSTVQDLGRTRFLDQAVPLSGVMDKLSAKIANLLVGNSEGAPLIEIVDGNFECLVQKDVLLAFVSCAADFTIDNKSIPFNRPFFTPTGAVIKVKNNLEGRYSYLAIAGGWNVPDVLGSKSTFVTAALGGLHGRVLKKEDLLFAASPLSKQNHILFQHLKADSVNWPGWSIPASQFLPASHTSVRVIAGREFDWFEDADAANFLLKPYQYKNGNRMGYRLEGATICRRESHQSELLSTAVVPGTIQVTGDGSLILLMADCQTTGGYPRLAKVAEVDLTICAQWKPGNEIHFELITMQDAEKLYIKAQNDFVKLAAAVQLKIETYNG